MAQSSLNKETKRLRNVPMFKLYYFNKESLKLQIAQTILNEHLERILFRRSGHCYFPLRLTRRFYQLTAMFIQVIFTSLVFGLEIARWRLNRLVFLHWFPLACDDKWGERLKPGTNESMFERRLIERLDEDVWTSNGGRELARNRRPIDTLLLGKYALSNKCDALNGNSTPFMEP